jgi:hypothetical protein
MRLEQTLGSLKALTAHSDDPTVRESVRFDEYGCVLAEPLVELEVVRYVTKLLLDLANGLEIGSSVECVASPQQQGNQVSGDIATSDVQAAGEVVQNGTLVDGDNMRDTIS